MDKLKKAINNDLPLGNMLFYYYLGVHTAHNEKELTRVIMKQAAGLSNHEQEDWGNLWHKLMSQWDDNTIDEADVIRKMYTSYRLKARELFDLMLMSVFG